MQATGRGSVEESRDWPVQLYSGIRDARCVLVRMRMRETQQVYDCIIYISGPQARSGSRAMHMVDMLPKASHARVTSTDEGTGPYLGSISDAMQAAYQRKTGSCPSPRNGACVRARAHVCVCVCVRARATGPPFRACQDLCVFTRGGLWLTSSPEKNHPIHEYYTRHARFPSRRHRRQDYQHISQIISVDLASPAWPPSTGAARHYPAHCQMYSHAGPGPVWQVLKDDTRRRAGPQDSPWSLQSQGRS